jgi:hypothetical protein
MSMKDNMKEKACALAPHNLSGLVPISWNSIFGRIKISSKFRS